MAIVTVPVTGYDSGTAYFDIAATAAYTLSSSSHTLTLPTVKIKVSPTYQSWYYELYGLRLNMPDGSYYGVNTAGRSASTTKETYTPAMSLTKPTVYTSDLFNVTNKSSKTRTVTLTAPSGTDIDVSRADGQEASFHTTASRTLSTITFTLNAPPTFTSSQVSFDTSEVYSGLTTASITTSNVVAQYEGEISTIKFTIGNQSVTSTSAGTMRILLGQAGTFTPTVSVTDKRGQTTTKSLNPITVKGYAPPSVNFNVERTGSNGVRADEGTYAVASANITFTDAIATLSAPTIKVDGTTVTPTWYSTRADNGALSGSVNWSSFTSPATVYALMGGSFSTQNSYQIGITPNDNMGSGIEITQTLPSAFYTVDFLAEGHGIAFGEAATQPGFFCNMDATFKRSVTVRDNDNVLRTLTDLFYPVGSYYETSDGNFDPNDTWGGTWVQELQGQVHVSAGASYPVTTTNVSAGGSKDAVVVAHTHQPLTANYFLNTYNTHAAGDMGAMSGSGRHYVYQATASSGSYWASNATTKSTGVSGTNANMMPYRVVYRWWRTA